MYTPQDWKILRNPILGLGFALVIMGLLAYYADQYHKEQQQQLKVEEQAYLKARQKYQTSGHEKDTIIKYLPLYRQLLQQGFIGEEQRIEWVETLRQIHQDNKLFGIEYDITEQKAVSPSYLPSIQELTLHQSSMQLEMGLLHEGDLLTLLHGLQSKFDNFIVNECTINLLAKSDIRVDDVNENMRADCKVDWFTLRDPRLETSS